MIELPPISWQLLMLIVGWCIAGFLAYGLVPLTLQALWPRDLARECGVGPAEKAWPQVTVAVPARDEEATIAATLQSLCEVDYPHLRIIAVNDRSTDRTGVLMDEAAANDSRVTVLHVHELPDGWLGKNHANWLAADSTDSPWILFTDGDILFHPQALRRAIHYVVSSRVDHLTLVPTLVSGGLGERVTLVTFGMLFFMHFKPWLARRRFRKCFVGIGAFNLVSRQAYETIGTHRRLALEVIDDVKLGKLIKQHGLRQDIFEGSELLRVRWQVGVDGVVRGLTKNAFAGVGYSLSLAIQVTLGYLAVFLSPYALCWCGPYPANLGFAAALIVMHIAHASILARQRTSILATVFLPAALLLFLYILWRSTLITLRQGGVVWRDTFYPLDQLRRGLV